MCVRPIHQALAAEHEASLRDVRAKATTAIQSKTNALRAAVDKTSQLETALAAASTETSNLREKARRVG